MMVAEMKNDSFLLSFAARLRLARLLPAPLPPKHRCYRRLPGAAGTVLASFHSNRRMDKSGRSNGCETRNRGEIVAISNGRVAGVTILSDCVTATSCSSFS